MLLPNIGFDINLCKTDSLPVCDGGVTVLDQDNKVRAKISNMTPSQDDKEFFLVGTFGLNPNC